MWKAYNEEYDTFISLLNTVKGTLQVFVIAHIFYYYIISLSSAFNEQE